MFESIPRNHILIFSVLLSHLQLTSSIHNKNRCFFQVEIFRHVKNVIIEMFGKMDAPNFFRTELPAHRTLDVKQYFGIMSLLYPPYMFSRLNIVLLFLVTAKEVLILLRANI